MRILYLVHGFPPTALGGTEIYAHALARELVKTHGDELFILARESRPERAEYALRRESQEGLEILWINNTFSGCADFEASYRNPELADAVEAEIEALAPDLIHAHHLSGLSTELLLRLSKRGLPVLFTLHDYWMICNRGQLFDREHKRCEGPYPEGCAGCVDSFAIAGGAALKGSGWAKAISRRLPWLNPLRDLLKRRLERLIASRLPADAGLQLTAQRKAHMLELSRHVTRFHSLSKTLHQEYLRLGVEPARLELHETGIPQEHLKHIERHPSERLRVGFLGSLIVSKAPHLLVQAFEGIPASQASLHFFGAIGSYHGDDSYRRLLEPLLAKSHVAAPRTVPHAQIAEALGDLDVLAVTSVWLENAPLVIREAFCAGLPVIAPDLGGMAEMVEHGKSGLLFKPGDSDSLRAAILRLVQEPELLASLREGLPEVKSVEQDACETRETYLELLSR